MDGWIRIGTELDTQELEKDLKDSQQKLKSYEKESEKLTKTKVKTEIDLKPYEEAKRLLEEQYREEMRLSTTEDQREFATRSRNSMLEELNKKYSTQLDALDKINKEIKENADNQELVKQKIDGINRELLLSQGYDKAKKGFQDIYKSAKKVVLGILSIRTAYTILSRAGSAYLASDTETTKKLEENWVGLGTVLAPVIEFLVDLMRKAVIGVLHFISVLTGVDYIAKANANALKSQTKATNDLRKANDKLTASFDEMNVLQDASTNLVGNNDEEVGNTLFDVNELSENTRKAIEKIATALRPIYDIIKNIISFALKHPEAIITILGGVALLKMLGKIIGVKGINGLLGIFGILSSIMALGVITISIVYTLQNYEKYQKALKDSAERRDKNHESHVQQTKDLIEEGKQTNITADKISELNDEYSKLTYGNLELVKAQNKQHDSLSGLERIVGAFNGELKSLKISTQQNILESLLALQGWRNLYEQGKLNDEQTRQYKEALNYVRDELSNLGYTLEDTGTHFQIFNKEGEVYVTTQEKLANAIFNVGKTASDVTAKDYFLKMSAETDGATKAISNVTLKAMSAVDKDYKLKMTADTSRVKSSMNNLFSGMTSAFTKFGAAIGLDINFPTTIKLAKGGIINNPGRGVSLGTNIIGGEAGPEMVLPLNSQVMAELGQQIGKWVTINANITNTMNGRVISRELQKVNNNSDFAFNR